MNSFCLHWAPGRSIREPVSPVNFTWRRNGSTLPICGPRIHSGSPKGASHYLTMSHAKSRNLCAKPKLWAQQKGPAWPSTSICHHLSTLPKIIPRHHLKTSTGLNQPSLVLRGFVHCRRLILQLLIHSSDLHAEGACGSAFRSQRVDPGLNIGTFWGKGGIWGSYLYIYIYLIMFIVFHPSTSTCHLNGENADKASVFG